jgi:hypothetical protein
MQLYEGVNLDHAYPIRIGEYDHEEYRDLHFEIEDGTEYVIYLVMDEIYSPGSGGIDEIAEEPGKLAMLVTFGVYGGTLGDVDYHRREVPIRTMYRIMATVMKAVVDQVKQSKVDSIVFAADKQEQETSRRRSYRTIAEQAAKYFDWRYMVSNNGSYAETYYIFSPRLTEEDIVALLIQSEDLAASTTEEAINQAFDLLDQLEIKQPLHEGIGKMYWKNGGPTRYQNNPTSFDDIKAGKAGPELSKGFDLNKREVHYMGPVLSDEMSTRIVEERAVKSIEFKFPSNLIGYTDIHSSSQIQGILNAFGRGVVFPNGEIRIGTIGSTHMNLSGGRADTKRFYWGYRAGQGSMPGTVYIVAKSSMEDQIFKHKQILPLILTQIFNMLKLNVATGGLRFMEDTERFIESKDYSALLQKMKNEKDPEGLDDFFNSLDEDVGMSTNFQLHTPEHMLSGGNPIALRTGKPGETGLSKAKRGRVEDDSWDGAYSRTVTQNYLRDKS